MKLYFFFINTIDNNPPPPPNVLPPGTPIDGILFVFILSIFICTGVYFIYKSKLKKE
jgi:hypothetical protein